MLPADTAAAALDLIVRRRPDAVLLDVKLPDLSGLEAYDEIRRRDHKLPVIFITAGGDSDTAIEAMKRGAYDYLLKPLDAERLRTWCARRSRCGGSATCRSMCRASTAGQDGRRPSSAAARPMQEVYKADRPRGRAGRHRADPRRKRHRQGAGRPGDLSAQPRGPTSRSWRSTAPPFRKRCWKASCSATSRAPSPGPRRRRIGKFEQCHGGTIFLDEIGDMTPLVQGKVLRVLQEQRFERVGGNETIQTDVRIIAATNRDLERWWPTGRFPHRSLLSA